MSIDDIKVGDYVRTKNGNIRKIIEITNKEYDDEPDYLVDKGMIDIVKKEETTYIENWLFKEQIIKSSSNIIDLIEVGDYVNGEEVNFADVIETWGNEKYCWTETGSISSRSIYSIVTKEQFEAMEYRIER